MLENVIALLLILLSAHVIINAVGWYDFHTDALPKILKAIEKEKK
jgi:hypothetical protein